jgi:hypothetical protein
MRLLPQEYRSRFVIWHRSFRRKALDVFSSARLHLHLSQELRLIVALLPLLAAGAMPAHAREKDVLAYGEGLIVNIPLPEPEVADVVEEEVQNTIIRGTKEYNKDEYVAGAAAAISTPVFPKWTENGKVFYKVRKQALDPRNFKDGSDVGTLAVRYVVKPQGDKNTVLRIDAIFVEDFRHVAHASNGSVESAEYKDIQDRLASIELVKKETAEALRIKQEISAKKKSGVETEASRGETSSNEVSSSKDNDTELLSTPPSNAMASDSMSGDGPNAEKTAAQATPASSQSSSSSSSAMPQPARAWQESGKTLDQHVAELRQQLERLVKQPGAPLKSAPFHTASTLKSLQPGAEVLIQITTAYWYGVETRDGDHGWIRRDQLERLP